ncbi:thiamine pyrophosphate-dependent dehydrogenase E1 component subunit alpha [Candidatus Roizmanbacteria bacterium]|nr:thiamine pyrophosphate-dependent dehydrogenase E1 component subunit alpha [Candidatus Roizmanbacteria bacterium]
MKLLEIYRKLYLIRSSEKLIIKHYKENEMKTPMHMSMGEEAIVVGIVAALQKKDQVFGTYRSHALYLAKTDDANKFFAELYGKVTGSSRGKAGSMHLTEPLKGMTLTSAVVGTTIPVAVGAALANKSLKNHKVVASFFGDGAMDEGVFWESLNFACLKKLPILFVCEDNNLAIHSPTSHRIGYKSIVQVASQFNCHVANSDSTDVFEICKIANEMIKKMKQTGMPGFLHLKYYRYLEHVGVDEDFHFGYRSKKEFLKWKRVDPLLVARRYLLKNQVKEKDISDLENSVERILTRSLNKARIASYPSEKELFTDIYG